MIDLDVIEQGANGATPGPWEWSDWSGVWMLQSKSEIETEYGEFGSVLASYPACVLMGDPRDNYNQIDHNAEYIASCDPQTVLALVQVVRAALLVDDSLIEELEPWAPDDEHKYPEAALHHALKPFRKPST